MSSAISKTGPYPGPLPAYREREWGSARSAAGHQPEIDAGPALGPAAFAELRRRMVFEHCKWDPQVEDVSVLAPFPLLISEATSAELAAAAESLAAETQAAEEELAGRADLAARLGLPRAIVRVLRRRATTRPPGATAPRVMRFDFHPTPDGWRISEVNSDVPGGFIEAAAFPRLVAERLADDGVGAWPPAGDPAAALCDAVGRLVPAGSTVGLVHATAYTDDRQVMVFLARGLEALGLQTCLVSPVQLRWRDGRADIESDFCRGAAAALVRFFPAEWLPNLPAASDWAEMVTGAETPLVNPATALLTQSKRFPLAWDELTTPLPTWRRLLPETRDPRDADWRRDDGWVLKPALGRVGEAIGMRGVTPGKEWNAIRRGAAWFPRHWAAQRRFDALPVEAPGGRVYPCLGVYTVGGRAAGIYGRIAAAPLVNHLSRDVAVLVRRTGAGAEG